MNDSLIPKSVERDASLLLQAMTLAKLQEIQEQGISNVLCELHSMRQELQGWHRHEMAKIDAESDELAKVVEEIAAGQNAEQATRLRALAAKLNAMGKPVVPTNP